LRGMLPQAPSSDTTGWFARDADTFARVSAAMLGEAISADLPARLIVAVDAFGFADAETAAALRSMVEKLGRLIGDTRDEVLAPPGLSVWARAQRTIQPAEAWTTFADWLDRENPRMAFSVARGLIAGSAVFQSDLTWATLMRREARGRLRYLLPQGVILCQPTTPFPAPLKGLPLHRQTPIRDRITCLCAHGGLAGVPAVSLPGADVDGAPVGLLIIGAPGSDAMLVRVAQAMADAR